MKNFTPAEAVYALIRESYEQKTSLAGYKRSVRALRSLGLSDYEPGKALELMEYHKSPDEPYEWLARKLAEETTV